MARINLNIGDELDEWIAQKANSIGIAKNAYILMCVANVRNQEENMRIMGNKAIFEAMLKHSEVAENEK